MEIRNEQIVAMSEAHQNFSRVARQADREGTVYIFKNNKPRYRLVALSSDTEIRMTDKEKIEFVAGRILRKYRAAFEELAK